MFCAAYVTPVRGCFSKAMPSVHPCVLKALKSTSTSHGGSTKLFEGNKFEENPPHDWFPGWKERFIEFCDKKELEIEKQEANNKHLTFNEFKKQLLMTSEKYTEKHQKYYDPETIGKGYEMYCGDEYIRYLMEKDREENQVMPDHPMLWSIL
jgi:hypothetical protein